MGGIIGYDQINIVGQSVSGIFGFGRTISVDLFYWSAPVPSSTPEPAEAFFSALAVLQIQVFTLLHGG